MLPWNPQPDRRPAITAVPHRRWVWSSRGRKTRRLPRLYLALLLSLLAGCDRLHYFAQATTGQMQLIVKRQPIRSLLQQPETSASLKNWLGEALAIREYASTTLGLPENGSYRSYVDLKRKYVVWNVIATPSDSLTPKNTCFPIAGCVPYLGFFSEASAIRQAEQLRAAGWDVYVYGVSAYSTLGWFDDPLLNTMQHKAIAPLARLLFHELAHQVLYIPNDSEFNESFAMVVEEAAMQQWLRNRPDQVAHDQQQTAQQAAEHQLMLEGRNRLQRAYAQQATLEKRLFEKARILDEMRAHFAALGQAYPTENQSPAWLSPKAGNAPFALFSTYDRWVCALSALLAQQNNDLPSFYRAAQQLSSKTRLLRVQALQTLASAACTPPSSNVTASAD